MIPQIVAYIQAVEPLLAAVSIGGAGVMVFGCIYWLLIIGFWGLIIFGIVQLVRYLGSARKEQKLIRMELGKLADEVQQIHKELKNGAKKGPLAKDEGGL